MPDIPQPPHDLLIGNLRLMDTSTPVQSLMHVAKRYGSIFRFTLPSREIIVVSSQELVHELCDEKRFDKRVHAALENIRDFAGDGLFTAYTEEPNWGKAHRILLPAFGPLGLRNMFAPMLDIAEQLMLRWERFGEHAVIDVADQMTRLTLDTIALCAFSYRFNSFYQNEMHPFIGAMVDGLAEAGARSRRPTLLNRALLATNRRFESDIELMHRVADGLIADRKADPDGSSKDDLLTRMLSARDPRTGEGLSDENIRYQMVTFLIAGHETTSGLLSFALYLLLQHPEELRRARSVVDDALGGRVPKYEDLPKLRQVEQVLMESLRLWPTAPAFALKPYEATTIGGRYSVKPDDVLLVLIPMLHRDPKVWGNDVEAFRPARFDREAEAKLPPDAWKPFGNGQRACIGRPFALQEALLVLSMILQRFDIVADDPGYQLHVKETLTLKPEGFKIRAKLRSDRPFSRSDVPPTQQRPLQPTSDASPPRVDGPLVPLLVLFGSNAGSAQSFAQRVGSDAATHGFQARVVDMDDAAGKLPSEGAVVIVTSSYEGQPPDNARQFVAALDGLKPGSLKGARYAVFGCGNRQWVRTYQAIPKKVDEALAGAGASQILPRGEADASGDFFGAFDSWYQGFWPAMANAFGKKPVTESPNAPVVSVEYVEKGRNLTLRQDDLRVGRLIVNRELVDLSNPLGRSKRHFEIELPDGMTYRAGDYLAILPRNAPINVERVMRIFGLAIDAQVVLRKRASGMTMLPTDYPIAIAELLSNYVELGQPATRAQVKALAETMRCPPDKRAIEALADVETYEKEVLKKRVSVLDLLEQNPSSELSFESFLSMLPTLKARQYSIASSPLASPTRVALCVAIVRSRATSGQGEYLGVASNFLANASPGTRLSVAVRPSNEFFHPPSDPKTPMALICAGTGLAPFRGFLQERAAQAQGGQHVGKTLLFFGCDHPNVDLLYHDELSAWQSAGVVDLRPAFTFEPTDGVKFVQDRVWKDRADLAKLFRAGAVVYVCGDGAHMAPAVHKTLARIYEQETGLSHDEALRVVEEVERKRGRFVEDVFA